MSESFPAIYEDGVIKPLAPVHLPEHQRVWVNVTEESPETKSTTEPESFYDAAARLGFLGCIKNMPSDLSTNPNYMDGFGKSGE